MPYVASSRAGLLGVDDDQVRSAAMADVQGSFTAIGERALRTIEALEAEKARVEARLLAAYGALHTIECQQVETLALTAGSLHVSADRVVSEEIALATGSVSVRWPADCRWPPLRGGTGRSSPRFGPARRHCTAPCRSRPRRRPSPTPTWRPSRRPSSHPAGTDG